MASDRIYEAKLIEFFVFIGIVLIATALLSYVAIHATNTMPPHAGVDVNHQSSGDYIVEIETMGQADRVTVYSNGTKVATLTDAGETVRLSPTPNKTKRIQVISDNRDQVMLLRDFYI